MYMLYSILAAPFVLFLAWHFLGKLKKTRKQNRRHQLYTVSIAPAWQQILRDEFPLYLRLPADLQRKLEGHISIFLAEKNIIGCNGLEITELVRVLIAAQACMLILNKASDYYPGFQTILVYPETYMAKVTRQDGALHSKSIDIRAGESWYRGPVVLAWSHVREGASNDRDGHNVVMHEFAHKLDEENSAMDGLPVLASSSQYHHWAEVLAEEYKNQQQKRMEGDADVIDSYGATSPAEFFAVVTETFFEKPHQLQRLHPKLYEQFRVYYQLDPMEWGEN